MELYEFYHIFTMFSFRLGPDFPFFAFGIVNFRIYVLVNLLSFIYVYIFVTKCEDAKKDTISRGKIYFEYINPCKRMIFIK